MSYKSVVVAISFALVISLVVPYSILFNVHDSAYGLSNFNIDSVGDWGCNSDTKSTVNNIKEKSPELVLALGDYSYQPTATCWLNTISSIKSFTKINIGNHENDANEDVNKYLSSFGLSKQYYSFNFQNVHVLTMATESSFSTSSAQYSFVKNDLATASANSNIKWIIVNYHRAMYTSPNTCSSSTCHGSSSLQNAYHPLFDKYGVDLVLQGHVHNYQRTYPIKFNPNSPSNPTKTSTSTNTYTDPQGEIFAIVGTGGINFHGLSGKSSFVASQQDSRFGILDLQVTDNGNKLEAKYYSDGGSVRDQFTITKSATVSGYHYDPSLSLTGSNFYDVSSSSALQLSKFTLAAWFKTSADYNSDAFVVNKGGLASETPGANLNYGIWMNSLEQLRAGFETSSGANNWVISPTSYNDGVWHYAVVTFDGSTVRFYIDGVQIASRSTSGSPDNSGSQPLRVGADSSAAKNFFSGNVDEIRLWNRALSAQEVLNAYDGTFITSGQVAHIGSSTSISSQMSSSQQMANIINGTMTSEKASNQSSINQTTNNTKTLNLSKIPNNTKTLQNQGTETNAARNQNIVPDLSKIPNNTKTLQNQGTETNAARNQKKNSSNTQNQNNNNPEVKPNIPKEAFHPKIKNILPESNAGKNQIGIEGSEVKLDGSMSKDKDGEIASYQWQQISGPKVVVDSASDSIASFISPPVKHDTILAFKLTVTDNNGSSDSEVTAVKVLKNEQSAKSLSKIPDPSAPSGADNSTIGGR